MCVPVHTCVSESLWVGEMDGDGVKRKGIIQLVLFLSIEMKAG